MRISLYHFDVGGASMEGELLLGGGGGGEGVILDKDYARGKIFFINY
jgi:hypothetical protein